MTDLRRLLLDERLVTVAGPPGIGKTRLAIQACSTLTEAPIAFPDGIRLVELAALSDPDLVVRTLGAAFG